MRFWLKRLEGGLLTRNMAGVIRGAFPGTKGILLSTYLPQRKHMNMGSMRFRLFLAVFSFYKEYLTGDQAW